MASELSTKPFLRMFGCDTARIILAGGKFFLVIGKKQHSEGEWVRNGEPYEFDYIKEEVIARGRTNAELVESAKEYKRLCSTPMEQYLQEVIHGK